MMQPKGSVERGVERKDLSNETVPFLRFYLSEQVFVFQYPTIHVSRMSHLSIFHSHGYIGMSFCE